ncbi:MAG TPA: tandem-95 repeat protein [Polyangiaceae bacterium]
MIRGAVGTVWAGVFGIGLALSPLLSGCGSGEGHRQVMACPEECPEGECDETTGICLAPAEASGGQGGQGGQGGEGGEPSPPAEASGGQGGSGGEGGTLPEGKPPVVVLTAPQNGDVTGSTVAFQFEADEPSTYTCTLNEEPVEACEPGITLSDLDSGANTFSVMATDEDGEESELVDVTFIVNYAPSIGEVPEIVTPEDVSTGAIPFSVLDPDSALADLIVTAELDSELPVPPSGLLLAGAAGDRSLSLTPAPNAFGQALLTLSVSDGFETTTRQVPVTVTPVNDAPSIEDVPDKRLAEGEVLGPITFQVADLETPAAELAVTARTSDPAKVPLAAIVLGGSGAERSFTITPAAQQSGTVTITLSVSDGQLTDTDTFVLTLGSTDDAPSISAIANQTTPEDTPKTVAFTVSDPDTNVSTLIPSASFDPNGIVQSVSFGGSGANRTFTVTPKANLSGSAPISITISDASGGVSSAFTLTVTPVNDAPSITPPANRSINEDTSTGALPFNVLDIDSATLSVSATSSDPALVPNANISVSPASGAPGTRNVTVTPLVNRSGGPVTITLSVSDGALTSTGTFTVTVVPVSDPPSITPPANQSINEDTSTGALAFSVADADSASVTVTATSSDQALVPNANIAVAPAAGAPGNRSVTVTPVANKNGGPVTITLTASDGALTATGSFNVTVQPVNDPPTISNITDRTVEPNTATGVIAFTVADPDGDTLAVSASSSDLRVVPTAGIALGGTGGNRTINVTPGTNQGGTSTLTVTVSDGHGGSASDTFVLSAKVRIAGAVRGNGSVVASGTGCPGGTASCTALPGAGTVTFVATPAASATFVGWSGACSGTGNGVVNPIPTAGATCTATFRNLWARLFYAPDDLATHFPTIGAGVVETSKGLRYLANNQPSRAFTSAVVWNADPATGAVRAGSAFSIDEKGTALRAMGQVVDPANAAGSVALVYSATRQGSGLLWLNDTNQLTGMLSYESANTAVVNVPAALVSSPAGGLAFVESTHNTSQVAVFPTLTQLVRVDGLGNVLGATVFREAFGNVIGGVLDCSKASPRGNHAPSALAVNSDGSYLVAGEVLNGTLNETNLTLLDKNGDLVWGWHISTRWSTQPNAITVNGNNFLVTGSILDDAGTRDAFALSISKTGVINWMRRIGEPGVDEDAFHGVASGTSFVVVGYTAQSGTNELFAATILANGSAVSGRAYGDAGNEQGRWLTSAAGGGYHLFGVSAGSFGSTAASAWALRVDKDLQITLETGSSAAFQPTLTAVDTSASQVTCVGAGTYSKVTVPQNSMGATTTAITVGGPYQANP